MMEYLPMVISLAVLGVGLVLIGLMPRTRRDDDRKDKPTLKS